MHWFPFIQSTTNTPTVYSLDVCVARLLMGFLQNFLVCKLKITVTKAFYFRVVGSPSCKTAQLSVGHTQLPLLCVMSDTWLPLQCVMSVKWFPLPCAQLCRTHLVTTSMCYVRHPWSLPCVPLPLPWVFPPFKHSFHFHVHVKYSVKLDNLLCSLHPVALSVRHT